ncbi:TEP1 [Cervus elaphus hippelaphus]|uniref:TEP1 n=1 Tax=Cervus elaphus hippelaphus TaxID=46360 RepID=A0A212CTH3_CEREH|nr:TEP1 [Cervus elaphus hippelaphus]
MRLLLVKRGSVLPLYLRLVTDHLRLFTLYEQVSERLRTLPATVPLLLQHILGTLEQEHGPDVLPQALATLEATRSASSVPDGEQKLPEADVAAFHTFLRQQAPILSRYPLLLHQQVANQPLDSPLCRQAPRLSQRQHLRRMLRWLNKPQTLGHQQSSSLSLAVSSSPTAVAFSPNGQRAAVGTANGTVYLLDLRTWQLWDTVRGQLASQHTCPKPLNCIAFHPEGQMIAVGSWAGSFSIFHMDGLRVTKVRGAGWPCGGKHGRVEWKELGAPGASVRTLAFSVSGRVVAVGRLDRMVELWAWQEGARLAAFPAHQGFVAATLFLRAGCQLLTAGEDGKVRFSPDGDQVAVGYRADGIRIYRISSASQGAQGQALDVAVSALTWLSSKVLSLLCWDVRTPKAPVLICSFSACHRDWVTGCAWTKDSLLISCSSDGSVALWDPESRQQLGHFLGHQHAVSAVVAVEEHVVSVGRDGTLRVWDHQGVEMTSIPAHSGPISHCVAALEPHAAGQLGSELLVVTVGLDGATRLWHPLLVFQTHTLLGHSGPVSAAAVSETSGLLLTASEDGSLRLWQVPEEADDTYRPRSPAAITAVAWAPDGSAAVSGNQAGELTLWQEAKAVVTVQGQKELGEFEECLEFDLNLENPSNTLISVTQAKPGSGEWCWEGPRNPEMALGRIVDSSKSKT